MDKTIQSKAFTAGQEKSFKINTSILIQSIVVLDKASSPNNEILIKIESPNLPIWQFKFNASQSRNFNEIKIMENFPKIIIPSASIIYVKPANAIDGIIIQGNLVPDLDILNF